MKKILLFMVLFVFVLSACTSPEPEVVEVIKEVPTEPEISVFQKAQNGRPFRFIYLQQSNPFRVLMIAGFLQACEDYGVLCELHGDEGRDEAKFVTMIEAFTPENTAGVVLNLNYKSRYVQSDELGALGIPYVALHVPVPRGTVDGLLGWAGPDPVEYGIEAGKAGAEKVQCEGSVAISQSGWGSMENLVTEAFVEGYLEVCPDAEILEKIALGDDGAAGIAIATGLLQANPDVSVAFSSTSFGAKSWVGAVNESDIEKGKIAIIGMDYLRSNLDLVKSGDVWMLVGQPAFEELYHNVVMLTHNSLGLPVPYENYLPAPQITLENVDDFFAIVDLAESVATGKE